MTLKWPNKFVIGVTVLGLTAPALAGCGGNEDDGGTGRAGNGRPTAPSPADDRKAVESVALEAFEAIYDGDGDEACAIYTEDYQRQVVEDARNESTEGFEIEGDTCEEVTQATAPVIKQFAPDPSPQVKEVVVRGDTATAITGITTSFGESSSRLSLVREGDDWKIDADVDLDESGEPEQTDDSPSATR